MSLQPITIEVLEGDAMAVEVDVLAVKYAQSRHGVDLQVFGELSRTGVDEGLMSPRPRLVSLVLTRGSIAANAVLFVGAARLSEITYSELAMLGGDIAAGLREFRRNIRSLALTLHGANFGLDEGESFLSLLAGLKHGILQHSLGFPNLERIVIVEHKSSRADYIRKLLGEVAPTGTLQGFLAESDIFIALRTIGAPVSERQHVLVAMPFCDEFREVYESAIKNAVNRSNLLCERADETVFAGDILSHVQKRIRTAAFVVADLSTANPNVYLEVGFAWGCGVPCVLLVRDAADLKFDVRGQRCILYKEPADLESQLYDELSGLRAGVASNSGLQLTWPSRSLGPRS